MTKELTEKEFIKMFSENFYQEIINRSYKEMRETPEFKNDLPVCTSIMGFPMKQMNGTSWSSLIIECNAKKEKKINIGVGTVRPIDFGISRIWVSTEDLPQVVLDRCSEYIKLKRK